MEDKKFMETAVKLADTLDKIGMFKEADQITEIIEKVAKKKKKKDDPKAKVRNRGDVVFSAESFKVKDNEDHFPINNENQARNALARANQYDKVPSWFKGSLKDLKKSVANKVKSKYKGIEVTDEAYK